MENCWFVLKQSQFPPPRLPVNGIGIANGAICPGQIVATVDDLEGVINRSVEGFEFTPAVPIHPTKAWDLKWETGKSNQAGLSLDGDIPIAQLVGLSAHAKAALAFQHTVQRYRCFDRLDRYIILPTRSYIADVLDDPQVQDHIHNRSKNRKTLGDFLGAWKIYMVTGVTIARGSRGGSSESQNISANTGLGAKMDGVASANLNATSSSAETMSMSAGLESDFVWAVRLTKIWKDVTDRTWSFKTQSKGSTFSLDQEQQQQEEIAQALADEGKSEAEKLWIGDEECFIVFDRPEKQLDG